MRTDDPDLILAAAALRDEANRVRRRFNDELAIAIVSKVFGKE